MLFRERCEDRSPPRYGQSSSAHRAPIAGERCAAAAYRRCAAIQSEPTFSAAIRGISTEKREGGSFGCELQGRAIGRRSGVRAALPQKPRNSNWLPEGLLLAGRLTAYTARRCKALQSSTCRPRAAPGSFATGETLGPPALTLLLKSVDGCLSAARALLEGPPRATLCGGELCSLSARGGYARAQHSRCITPVMAEMLRAPNSRV